MIRSLRNYLSAFISLIASIITIVIYSQEIYPEISSDARPAIALIGGICSWYFLENIYLRISKQRKKDYEQALSLIFDGASDLFEAQRRSTDIDFTMNSLKKLCNYLAKAFTVVTGTNCSISIKLLVYDEDENGIPKLKAVTICRDEHSASKRPKRNDAEKIKHWLHENTDYADILYNSNAENHFHSNQLPFLPGYQNTSFAAYGYPENVTNYYSPQGLFRYWRWRLPYMSTIVVPISPGNDEELDKIVGFLCVDSPTLGAFNRRTDVNVLAGVADMLFNILDQISRHNIDRVTNGG